MNQNEDGFDLKKVLLYLKSSQYIEEKLINFYTEPKFHRTDYRKGNKRRPLLIGVLYSLILQLRDLPTLVQFEEAYKHKLNINDKEYFSEVTAIRRAYQSLVRDLHFYFLLKESNKFDCVEMDYLFDLYAQTDILISKGEKTLGLQLFTGGASAKERKQKYYEPFIGKNNYNLLFFGTEGKGTRKIIETKSGKSLLLYSESDVLLVFDALMNSEEISVSLNDDNFDKYDEFVESRNISPINNESSKSKVKHSVLDIGIISELERESNVAKYTKRGITYYYCEIKGIDNHRIYDGKDFDKIESLFEHQEIKNFNLEQYKIEHELSAINVAVLAGAGSGKTYTLVSRMLYLLNMGFVQHVNEVAMITFTNEAANNILESLTKRFRKIFHDTSDTRFLRYLEELREMKIMTIPAFAKFVLNEYGHHIGLGQNIQLSSLTMKKRELIEQFLNEIYQTNKFDINELKGIQYHEIRKFMEQFSEKLEQKGVFAENIQKSIQSKNSFEILVIESQKKIEEDISKFKQERDMLELSDLTRYLGRLIQSKKSIQSISRKFKYLFVDEFQDTDKLQIEFIVNLSVKANIPLLVVGDIKQGIYRFRGAEVTAFDYVDKYISELTTENQPLKRHKLLKNYRTATDLLNKIEDSFERFRESGYLTADERMLGTQPNSNATNYYIENELKIEAEDIVEIYEEMNERSNGEEKNILSILVRTNRDVERINKLLSASCENNRIPLQVVKEGTLFKSLAARDLNILLYSWLHPTDSVALFELAQTPFCKLNSNLTLVDSEFYEMEEVTFELPKSWDIALEQFKLAPANIVLNEFLKNTPFERNLQHNLNELEVKQYVLNMHKLIVLMNNAIQSESTDLYSIYKWMSIEITTNTRDDEAELTEQDFSRNFIKVMTVHKSKGLEFDTVVIPYMHTLFEKKQKTEILIETQDKNVEYAWNVHYDSFTNETENYTSMRIDESSQILMEETRNLYVALTRAKQQLVLFDMKDTGKNSNGKINSWYMLMKGGK